MGRLLDDGATYKLVAEEMARQGVALNGENISNWFNGPYQDHLRQRDRRAELQRLRESAADLDELTPGHKFQEILLQLAMTEIFRALNEGQMQSGSPNYIRLFHALARLSREAFALRKYDELQAQGNADLFPLLDTKCNQADEE